MVLNHHNIYMYIEESNVSCAIKVATKMNIKFPAEPGEYEGVLNRFKTEFEKKWKENVTAPAKNASDFEDIRVLGSGAFGIVVIINNIICFERDFIMSHKAVNNNGHALVSLLSRHALASSSLYNKSSNLK